jgi:hypothetical protein
VPAPVGHRQPRAAEIPANAPKNESDAWPQRLNREIDRKLQICRGCGGLLAHRRRMIARGNGLTRRTMPTGASARS